MTVVNVPSGVTNRLRGLSQSVGSFFDFQTMLYQSQDFARNLCIPLDFANVTTMRDVIAEDTYVYQWSTGVSGKITTGKQYIVGEPLKTFNGVSNREIYMKGRQVNMSFDYVDQDFYPSPYYISKKAILTSHEFWKYIKQMSMNEAIYSWSTKKQRLSDSSANGVSGTIQDVSFNQSVDNDTKDLDLSGIERTSSPDEVYDIISQFIADVKYLREKQGGAFAIRPCVLITASLLSEIRRKLKMKYQYIEFREDFKDLFMAQITGRYTNPYPSFEYEEIRWIGLPEELLQVNAVRINLDNTNPSVATDGFYGNGLDGKPNYTKTFAVGKCIVIFPDRCCLSSSSLAMMIGRDVGFGSVVRNGEGGNEGDSARFVMNDNRMPDASYSRVGENPMEMLKGLSLVNMANVRGVVQTDFGIRSSMDYNRAGNENVSSPINMEVLFRSPDHYIANSQQFKYQHFTLSDLTDYDGARNIKVSTDFLSNAVVRKSKIIKAV